MKKVLSLISFSRFYFKMETEIKIFHCHIQLAMKNKIQWDILLSMTDELCSSFEKCLKVIHVLLDELKTYKNLVVIPKKQITSEKEASDENSAMKNESADPLEMEVKTDEMTEDVFEDSEDFKIETYPDDEEYFDQDEVEDEIEAGSYNCEECLVPFKHKKSLYRHQRENHSIGIQKTESSPKKSKVEVHNEDFNIVDMKSIPGSGYHEGLISINDEDKKLIEERFVKCDQCDKMITKGNLGRHIKNVHEKIPRLKPTQDVETQCPKCGKMFLSEDKMKKHLWATCNDKKYYCDQCEKSFKSNVALRSHKEIIHEGKTDNYSCDQCGKTFSRPTTLTAHIQQVHENIKNFKCEQCPTRFATKTAMKNHIKAVHEGIKDHMCSECGKSFSVAETLRNHIASVHRKERPFSCEFCEQTFSEKKSVVKHVSTVHKKEWNYACNQCPSKFSTPHYLKKHIKIIHKGISLFECQD